MSEESLVNLTVKPGNYAGTVAVGSYVLDAAKRLGYRQQTDCDTKQGEHHCFFKIKGDAMLSPLTAIEQEQNQGNTIGSFVRLGCQAKFTSAGEAEIEFTEIAEQKSNFEQDAKTPENEIREKFNTLPLEKKIAELIRLETIAFAETLEVVLTSPYLLGEKLLGVLSEFGMKIEKKQRQEQIPPEHRSDTEQNQQDKEAS